MRIIPNEKYNGLPCSYVGTGCAYEDLFEQQFNEAMIPNLKGDGWSSLDNTNKYVRSILPIKKKIYYKRNERIILKDFLENNNDRCLVCVYGHFIYVNGSDYWSFFDNDNDEIVCIWYVDDDKVRDEWIKLNDL